MCIDLKIDSFTDQSSSIDQPMSSSNEEINCHKLIEIYCPCKDGSLSWITVSSFSCEINQPSMQIDQCIQISIPNIDLYIIIYTLFLIDI